MHKNCWPCTAPAHAQHSLSMPNVCTSAEHALHTMCSSRPCPTSAHAQLNHSAHDPQPLAMRSTCPCPAADHAQISSAGHDQEQHHPYMHSMLCLCRDHLHPAKDPLPRPSHTAVTAGVGAAVPHPLGRRTTPGDDDDGDAPVPREEQGTVRVGSCRAGEKESAGVAWARRLRACPPSRHPSLGPDWSRSPLPIAACGAPARRRRRGNARRPE
eukprot:116705-Chlamydomonas_euryale.AAC.5